MLRTYQIGNMQCVLLYFVMLTYILREQILYAQTIDYGNNNSKGNIIAGREIQDEHQILVSTEIPPRNSEFESNTSLERNRTAIHRLDIARKANAMQLRQMVIKKQLETCPDVPLCTYNATNEFVSCCEGCSCNVTTCADEGSCCADIIDDTYFDVNTDISVSSKQCLLLTIGSQDATYGKLGITSCPSHVNNTNTRLCSQPYMYTQGVDLQDLTPVYDNNTFIIYRNKYCAHCHGLSEDKFAYFDPMPTCKNFSSVSNNASGSLFSILKNEDCKIEFYKNETRLNLSFDYCIPLISDCNVTGNWAIYDAELERACKIYKSPVTHLNRDTNSSLIYETMFQNIFCLLCNGFNETQIESNCSNEPMDIDFDFSRLLKGGETEKPTQTQNNVFCGKKKTLLNGRCISLFESYTNIYIRIPLRIFPMEPLNKSKIEDHVNVILKTISNLIDQNQALKNICIDNIRWYFRTHPRNIEDIQSSVNVSQIENTSLDVLFEVVAHGEINANIANIFMSLFQNKNVTICLECMSNETNTEDNTDIYTYTLKYDSDLLLPTPIYDNGTSHDYGDTLVYYCNLYYDELSVFDHFDCPLIALSHRNISWKKSFDGKLLIGQTITLDSDQYYFLDHETVVVCKDMYINSIMPLDLAQSTYSDKLIISLVCISLSLLALAVSLIIYVLVDQLKKGIPGINAIFLMCLLFLAQTLYLVSSVGNVPLSSAACVALGFVLHYSWLLVMFEMNVCTYHMFYVLAVTRIIAGGTRWMRCFKYQMYALLSSALWVCVHVILSEVINNDIGYGKANCYINKQTMVYIAFGIPVAFVIVTNFLMFVKVVIHIRQGQNIQRHVANDRNEIGIFVKLSTLTGLTWVFGLVDSVANLTPLAYLFTIFNASQGVFLFFSFICNRRVLIDLKKHFNLSSDRTVTLTNSGTPKCAIQANSTNATTL